MNTKLGKVLFISGVDTDSGKTFVTSHLAAHLLNNGVHVITQKPVQTGCNDVEEDLLEHRKAMGVNLLPEDLDRRTCSYLFHKPASPDLAARLEGARIVPEKIDNDTAYLRSLYDVTLVEGAGGLMVPLNDELLTIDYIASRHIPLLLVTTSKLGGINHALLSIEACLTHNVDLKFVVFNRLPNDEKVMADDNLDAIKKFTHKTFPNAQVIDFSDANSFANFNL